MKSYFSVLLVFLFFGALGHAQIKYKSHFVKEGETVSSITKQYKITQEELFRMNPEVKNGLKHNTVLIIPTSETLSEQNDVTFKTHTVKRRETLFSLSQLYNVSQEEIKKYNKHLYSETLRNGEEIRIPVKSAVTIVTNAIPGATVEKISEASPSTHIVAAKETKYGIARKYGITVADINALNPEVAAEENLPIGITLKVPDSPSEESAVPDEENYTYYEVKPKEGFFRLKENFGWTEEAVKANNPDAVDGLKEGMILKMPKDKTPAPGVRVPYSDKRAISLEYNLTNFSTKDVVVFLPFQLDKVEMDSIADVERQMINNASLRIALDFYSGVRMAADFAKKKGISVNLHIFDTREMEGGTLNLFNRKNVQKADVVIGPLRQAMVERVASDLQGRNIPVISPLSNRQSKMYPNFIQSIPSNDYLEERMIAYLSANSNGKSVYLISDGKKSAQRQKLINAIPGLITIDPVDGGYVKQSEITNRLTGLGENWVILETTNAALVSSTVTTLNSLRRSKNVRLFTLDKNDAFEYSEISNVHLSRLGFTFPSVNKGSDVKDVNEFVNAYKDQYGIMPNRFAARGFDVTYDALLRLAYSESLFTTNEALDAETLYNENKFYYKKNANGGYHNTSVYILKYNEELLLEEVK